MQLAYRFMGALLIGAAIAAACGGGDAPAAPPIDDVETPGDVEPRPSPTLRASAIPTPMVSTYIVQAGDSIGLIADKLDVTIDSLIDVNQLADIDTLFIGQEITVVSDDGPTITPDGPQADALVRVQVISVTNVHTIRARLPDGTEATVRYIGVDAPDEASAFATEATARNTELVDGRFVFLESDGTGRDQFNRLLRYVWIEESNLRLTLVNAALVAVGLARVAAVPSETKYRDLFMELQDAAQAAGLRIWSNRP